MGFLRPIHAKCSKLPMIGAMQGLDQIEPVGGEHMLKSRRKPGF
jgi:hypothetical protein